MLKNGCAQACCLRLSKSLLIVLAILGVLVPISSLLVVSEAFIFGLQTHLSLDLGRLNCRAQQIPHTHQVVSSGRKAENPSHSQPSSMSCLA